MKKMVRCSACGYIMEEGKLGDRCPACGAARKAFVPYTDPMSQKRRKVLNLDLHPIAVHFPTSFAVAALLLSIAIVFLSGDAKVVLVDTVKILVLFIPITVILAAAVGLWDGKVRFKAVGNSKILKTKILWASILFIVSSGLFVVVWISGLDMLSTNILAILFSAIAVAVVTILGKIGSTITEAAFPG